MTHDLKGNAITEYGDLDSQILPQQLEPATSVCSTAMNLRIPSRTNSVLYDDSRSLTGSHWQTLHSKMLIHDTPPLLVQLQLPTFSQTNRNILDIHLR